MINVNKLNKILYNDYGIILNESENAYLKYLNNTSDKNITGILKEFFAKCTTRHLCIENNKKDLNRIRAKLLSEEIGRNLRSNDSSIMGGDYGNVNIGKYLHKEDVVEIEEETNTVNGNEGLNYKKDGKKISKEFDTKEEANLYKQTTENQFMVRRIGSSY